MTLKCTVDGRPEAADHLISVCHHCGRPLCEQHGWVVSADDAFDESGEEPDSRTPQSPDAKLKYPQPAMHCKQCADENHSRAYKHPGWADPKKAQRDAQTQARAAQAARAPRQQQMAQTQWQGPQPQDPQQGQAWGQPGQQRIQQQGRATGRP